ncbi:hypothetical protein [Lysinibacillus xylanilyticus]
MFSVAKAKRQLQFFSSESKASATNVLVATATNVFCSDKLQLR